ncbi:MAG: hypothetical protein IH900_02045 [Proteobacteria bacterium]|nr:hypothetical protein [Pseudomonadota bacterium]
MTGETETEGRALMVFMAGLAGAPGALADYPTSQAAPPQLGDALDDLLRAFRHGEHNVRQALDAEAHGTDPWARCFPKIVAEVTASHQAFVAVLATWEISWWTRRLDELDRQHQAEQRYEVGR